MPNILTKITRSVLFGFVIISIGFTGHHQNKVLSGAEKKIIIDTCISTFRTYYIYPDILSEIEKKVISKYRDNGYDQISDLKQLTCQLRKDFRSVSNDRHIWIDILENLPVKDANVSEQEKTDELEKINFGFNGFEILSGNTGYLKLDAFSDYKYGSTVASDIMNKLSECNAIIIDLRENHGGNENMVRFIASYFFSNKVQLNSLYFRYNDTLVKEWTDPDVAGNKLIQQKLLILTSENTASAAESFTYLMKHYNRAIIVGQKTRGAAHWNETFIIRDLDIFMEIPVARPVNPVTSTDWEGTGIIPDIPVPADQALGHALRLIRDKNPVN